MEEIIRTLKTPEECWHLEKIFTDLVNQALRQAVELRTVAYGHKNQMEKELIEAIYAYEEVLAKKHNRRTPASRTWPMVEKYGIIGAAERAVNRKTDALGYKMLVEMGMHDLTFESVIVRFPKVFSKEAFARAKTRLDELKKYNRTKLQRL
jgi:ATP-dependent protease Clp ATPase subunit